MPTLKSIYQACTGDRATHQRTIGAQLARESARRRKLVKEYVSGASDRVAGARTGRSYGAARAMLRGTMSAIWRRVHAMPRYWKHPRPSPKRDLAARRWDGIQSPDGREPRSLAREALAAAAQKGK